MHDLIIGEFDNLYQMLEQAFDETGGHVAIYSPFSKGQHPFLIKSAPDETAASSAGEVVKIRQPTSVPQASEWDMRVF